MVLLFVSPVCAISFPFLIAAFFFFGEWNLVIALFETFTPETFGFLIYLAFTFSSYPFLIVCFSKLNDDGHDQNPISDVNL